MACPCCCSEPGACCVPSGSGFECQQKTSCECSTVSGWFYGAGVACSAGLCNILSNPCSFCCNSLPSTFSVAIQVQFDKLVLGASTGTFSGSGSRTTSASGVSSSKTLTANVTLTGGSGACRSYNFSGCGPYGDMQNLSVSLSQAHGNGDCRWQIAIVSRHLSAATYVNDANFNTPNCVTGTTENFFDSGNLQVSDSVVSGRTCNLSGLAFSGVTTIVREACVESFGTNTRICRIANFNANETSADVVVGSLPEQIITATWSATIV